MSSRSPEQSRAAYRRYYSGKGRERRHQRYIDQRDGVAVAGKFNPQPLEQVIRQHWREA